MSDLESCHATCEGMRQDRTSLELARRHVRGLYGITPVAGEGWSLEQVFAACGAAFDEGLKLLQVRQKNLDMGVWADWVQRLGREAESAGAVLILNDPPPLPELSDWPGVHGVHLGRSDLPVTKARETWPEHFVVGASCYNDPSLARLRVQEGADYLAFGALFVSATKPQAVRAPLELFKEPWPVPAVGIGGLEPGHVPALRAARVDAFAVVSSLFPKPDNLVIKRAVQTWLNAVEPTKEN